MFLLILIETEIPKRISRSKQGISRKKLGNTVQRSKHEYHHFFFNLRSNTGFILNTYLYCFRK